MSTKGRTKIHFAFFNILALLVIGKCKYHGSKNKRKSQRKVDHLFSGFFLCHLIQPRNYLERTVLFTRSPGGDRQVPFGDWRHNYGIQYHRHIPIVNDLRQTIGLLSYRDLLKKSEPENLKQNEEMNFLPVS